VNAASSLTRKQWVGLAGNVSVKLVRISGISRTILHAEEEPPMKAVEPYVALSGPLVYITG